MFFSLTFFTQYFHWVCKSFFTFKPWLYSSNSPALYPSLPNLEILESIENLKKAEVLVHSLCTFKGFISNVKLTKLYLKILVWNKDSFCGLKIRQRRTRTWSESILNAVALKKKGGLCWKLDLLVILIYSGCG